KEAVWFGEEDEKYLRFAGEIIVPQVEEMLTTWMSLFGSLFASYFIGPDGQPDKRYMEATHARFVQWFSDTCFRPYDQYWLNYQHEIGLRHHRNKKNRIDNVDSVPFVHQRYLTAFIYPMSQIRPFLSRKGQTADKVEKMLQAWTKSLVLQVALWSYPYVTDGDW